MRERPGVRRSAAVRSLPGLAAVLIITAVAFSPMLSNSFLNWDDDLYVTANRYVQDQSGDGLRALIDRSTTVGGNYQPLTMISFWLNYRFAGAEPFAYHATNLALHLLNTLLVFVFFTLLSRGRSEIGLIVALFFAIHPMHVASVAWVSGRKDVLYGAFFLMSLLAWLGYLRTDWSARWRAASYLLAAVGFTASALAKPSAVVLPVVLLLVEHLRERPIGRGMLLDKIPLLAVSVWIGLATIGAQAGEALGSWSTFSMPERVAIACYGISAYLFKLVVPSRLSAFHPYPAGETLPLSFWLAPLLVAALAALVVRSARSTRLVVFGALFFLVTSALTLQLVSVGSALIAERYTYLPYLGPTFIAASGYAALRRKPGAAWQVRASSVALGLFAAAFTIVTHERCKVWRDSETLWTDAIEKYPGRIHFPVAYSHRADALRAQGEIERAIEDYRRAIEMRPDYADAHNNLGNLLFELGRDDEAIEHYTRAIENRPDKVNAWANRGAARSRRGEREAALADFARAIRIDPTHPHTWLNRTQLHLDAGDLELAIADLDIYLGLVPEDAQAWRARGIAHRQLGEHAASLRDFDRALRLAPGSGDALLGRSLSLERLGRFEEALADARAAVEAGARIPAEHLERLERLGAAEDDGARAQLQRAIDASPEDPSKPLALAEWLAGRHELEQAEQLLRASAARWPCHEGIHVQLANIALRARGRTAQVAELDRFVARCDATAGTLNDLAYLLATAHSPEVRDGERALLLVERALEEYGDHPLVLDTLAVVQAENGDFEGAIATSRRAVEEGLRAGLPPDAIALLRAHMARLSERRPVRE